MSRDDLDVAGRGFRTLFQFLSAPCALLMSTLMNISSFSTSLVLTKSSFAVPFLRSGINCPSLLNTLQKNAQIFVTRLICNFWVGVCSWLQDVCPQEVTRFCEKISDTFASQTFSNCRICLHQNWPDPFPFHCDILNELLFAPHL